MRIGIIGFGNMGSAFGEALAKQVGKEKVTVYDKDPKKQEEALKGGFGVATDLYFLLNSSDLIFLAVKPKDAGEVLEDIKEDLKDKILVSTVAGLSISEIERIVGKGQKIVRIMPNINVKVGKGTIAVAQNGVLSDEEWQEVLNLLSESGSLYQIPEELFDSFTALAGSLPAFVFAFMDALAIAGVKEGFSYGTALSIVTDTLIGSAYLVKVSGGNPNEWITKVTSPAGTTVEGLTYLEEKGFRGLLIKCIEKTSQKAKRLT